MPKLLNNSFNLIPENEGKQAFLVILLAIAMFLIRVLPIHNIIFTDWPADHGNFVNFSADDAVYHMRLVHNTIHHFPWRVFFDPFTHFPYGNQIHFGPLFTLIIAGVALIVGLGHPSPELVNIVGAYTPPVMGALCLFPLYFIARKLLGKPAAILSALVLAFLPGEFLQRSALGFADHHVAEVLFSTITCAFLIYALSYAKSNPFDFKPLFKFGILTGIAFGLFVLTWPAALMFGVIFLLFFLSQLIIDHFKGEDTTYLLILAITTFVIPALMILPYAIINPRLELPYYSLVQPLILVGMVLAFALCHFVHILCQRKQWTKDFYTVILAMIFVIIGLILYYYVPKLFVTMQEGCKLLFEPTAGMKTVSEVHPSIIDPFTNKFSLMRLWYTYFWALPLTGIGFGYLGYRAYKYTLPTEVLFLTWSLCIILAAIAQCRFNYYLAINASILAGSYGFYPIINFFSSLKPKLKRYQVMLKVFIYTFFGVFALLIVDPMIMLLMDRRIPSGLQITLEQYLAYQWLKKHTPDPQGPSFNSDFDYKSGCYPIPKKHNLPYSYPKDAYGILSWWDFGHQITYIAERIPNANPFQLGVVEDDNKLGAAPFFTCTDETEAVNSLNLMGTRYILIDENTAENIEGVGIWSSNTQDWSRLAKTKIFNQKGSPLEIYVDSPKFSQSMMNRLFYRDTNSLKHFRLVYESEGLYSVIIRRNIFQPYLFINRLRLNYSDYDAALRQMEKINSTFWNENEVSPELYYARPPVKRIKIYEKVKGAVLSGVLPKNVTSPKDISLSINIKTKYGRVFTYEQTPEISDGRFKFTVPYPTTNMVGNDYRYDIVPLGYYEIKVGPNIIKVFVSEDDVMSGKVVEIV